MTPTGFSLRDITPDVVVTVSRKGRVIGEGAPSKDVALHLGVIGARADIHVVCHVHGPYLIALSTMVTPGPDVLPPLTPGFVYFAYPLRMLPFLVPGSGDLAESAAGHFSDPSKRALLLQNHGLVTVGADFQKALNIAEEIDEAARIFVLTGGKASVISEKDVARIKALK